MSEPTTLTNLEKQCLLHLAERHVAAIGSIASDASARACAQRLLKLGYARRYGRRHFAITPLGNTAASKITEAGL